MHAINLACKYMFFSRIEGLMANVRFSFVSDKQVAAVRENRVPSATKRHTLWCNVRVKSNRDQRPPPGATPGEFDF